MLRIIVCSIPITTTSPVLTLFFTLINSAVGVGALKMAQKILWKVSFSNN